jgi:hypothetical protein
VDKSGVVSLILKYWNASICRKVIWEHGTYA